MDAKDQQEEVERLRRSNEELTFLRDLAHESSLSSNFEALIKTIVSKAIRAVHAEQGAILLLEGDTGEGKTLVRSMATSGEQIPISLNQTLLGWMGVHKKPLNLSAPAQDPRFKDAGWDAATRSLACVPLLIQSDIIGALAVFNKKGSETFTDDDMRLLTIIAGQSAQMVENARLSDIEHLLEMLKLTQSQLIQSKKMASLGSMVTGLLHELNNAFGAIQNSGDLIARCVVRMQSIVVSDEAAGESDKEMQRYIGTLSQISDTVQQASQRVSRMLKSLKSFADVDESHVTEVDINHQIDDALVLLEHVFAEHISVERKFGDIPALRCNRGEIGQVFINILTNAAEAIDSRGSVRIRTEHIGGDIQIEITDTGRGISEHQMRVLFDPAFNKSGHTVKAGIGLFVCSNIVHKLGGNIEADSKLGQGTTIRLRLPLS
jgi:signal transduction histidine kinase